MHWAYIDPSWSSLPHRWTLEHLGWIKLELLWRRMHLNLEIWVFFALEDRLCNYSKRSWQLFAHFKGWDLTFIELIDRGPKVKCFLIIYYYFPACVVEPSTNWNCWLKKWNKNFFFYFFFFHLTLIIVREEALECRHDFDLFFLELIKQNRIRKFNWVYDFSKESMYSWPIVRWGVNECSAPNYLYYSYSNFKLCSD